MKAFEIHDCEKWQNHDYVKYTRGSTVMSIQKL